MRLLILTIFFASIQTTLIYQTFNNKTFALQPYEYRMPHDIAEKICKYINGRLAVIHCAQEVYFLSSLIESDTFIGGIDGLRVGGMQYLTSNSNIVFKESDDQVERGFVCEILPKSKKALSEYLQNDCECDNCKYDDVKEFDLDSGSIVSFQVLQPNEEDELTDYHEDDLKATEFEKPRKRRVRKLELGERKKIIKSKSVKSRQTEKTQTESKPSSGRKTLKRRASQAILKFNSTRTRDSRTKFEVGEPYNVKRARGGNSNSWPINQN